MLTFYLKIVSGNLTSTELIHLKQLPRVLRSILCWSEATRGKTGTSTMCTPAARNSSSLFMHKKDTVLVVSDSKSLKRDVEKLKASEIFVELFDVLEGSCWPRVVRMEGIRDDDFSVVKFVPLEVQRAKASLKTSIIIIFFLINIRDLPVHLQEYSELFGYPLWKIHLFRAFR